jgi:hypothetical protein
MSTYSNLLLAALLLCLSGGCASVKVDKSAKVDLSAYHSFYVVQQTDSELHTPIVDELQALGHSATSGPRSSMPPNTDILVTYKHAWMWDITMYLLEYELQFRRPDDEAILASGKSYRPSLQRKDPKFMAHEILAAMYAQK